MHYITISWQGTHLKENRTAKISALSGMNSYLSLECLKREQALKSRAYSKMYRYLQEVTNMLHSVLIHPF